MVPSIARQSVIIKCNQQTSVLLGNYEFYYLAGLMKKVFELDLDEEMRKFAAQSAEKCGLTARGLMRILRLARTIADLQNEKKVSKMHVMEALSYRHKLLRKPN